MISAEMLNHAPVSAAPAMGGPASLAGKCQPKRFSRTSFRYPENPTATAMLETAYSRIRSHPMIQQVILDSHIGEARDGAGSVVGVQRGKHQVAGERGADGNVVSK